jgi:hypothetical protein
VAGSCECSEKPSGSGTTELVMRDFAQDRDRWHALVNVVMKLRVLAPCS